MSASTTAASAPKYPSPPSLFPAGAGARRCLAATVDLAGKYLPLPLLPEEVEAAAWLAMVASQRMRTASRI
jgi:hypothetical protein